MAEGAYRKSLSSGERIQLSWLEIKAGAKVPEHSHPNEQAGYTLKGKMESIIGKGKAGFGQGNPIYIPYPDVLGTVALYGCLGGRTRHKINTAIKANTAYTVKADI
ncbi:cupin domain-containing protein [Thermodesulfobacteriota bacterium]